MQIRAERAKVLVTVKASPQPSAKYGDTVCVAGIRYDGGEPRWIRLYPVPFRWLDTSQQFSKYDLIEVDVRRASNDTREESFRPDIDSLEKTGHLDGWGRRQQFFEALPRATTCDLHAEARRHHAAPSLGMVEVASLDGLEFGAHPGWSDAERRKIAQATLLSESSLFGADASPAKLSHPRYKVRYRYHCRAGECPGHVGQILDWELTALQNRHGRETDDALKTIVTERFSANMFRADRLTSFFMGNFEDPRKRQNFSVLGIHYPTRAVASSQTLLGLDESI